MLLHVSSTCGQEVKIALHSLWYHHTYRCDDTRGCIIQFWPPDDEHMCSKYAEAWNKLIVKQKFCASSWLITEINILRCTVSKTSQKLTDWAGTPVALHLLSVYSRSMSSSLIIFLSSNFRSPKRCFPLHFYEQYFTCIFFFTFFVIAI